MGDLPGWLALLGALLLSGERGPGVLGTGLLRCWGGVLDPLDGVGGVAGSKLVTSVPRAAFWVSPGRVLSLSIPRASVLAVPPRAVSLPGPAVRLSVHSVAVSVCPSVCLSASTVTPHLWPRVPAYTGSMCASVCAFTYVHSAIASLSKCLMSACPCVCWVCICVSLCVHAHILVPYPRVLTYLHMCVIAARPMSVPLCSTDMQCPGLLLSPSSLRHPVLTKHPCGVSLGPVTPLAPWFA